jgi:hypothetical protein
MTAATTARTNLPSPSRVIASPPPATGRPSRAPVSVLSDHTERRAERWTKIGSLRRRPDRSGEYARSCSCSAKPGCHRSSRTSSTGCARRGTPLDKQLCSRFRWRSNAPGGHRRPVPPLGTRLRSLRCSARIVDLSGGADVDGDARRLSRLAGEPTQREQECDRTHGRAVEYARKAEPQTFAGGMDAPASFPRSVASGPAPPSSNPL